MTPFNCTARSYLLNDHELQMLFHSESQVPEQVKYFSA